MAQVILIDDGGSIDYSPMADVAAGDVVVQGELVGVAKLYIPTGQLGALAVVGVFDFPVALLTGWAVGDLTYWDNTAKVATETASDNNLLGKTVLVDSRPGSPHVRARLSQSGAMPDLLRIGSDWLAEMLKEHASRPVVYRRGVQEVAV
ncbi:MAG: DUF2190 family protein [Gemmataceae bacterium]|nr:DUF2190 family protein [Gemmataceae bacterium]